jgi:anaerobic selenocysteine-containing dehydrogenase
MSEKITRRDFLKIAGVGGAVATVLTGCGPASRYVSREPYTKMPEYTYNGQSTYYATTCRECAAGCGLVVRTMQGRAIKVEGNKLNPVNLGKTCARGQATLHGLYNPDRVMRPGKHARGTKIPFTVAADEQAAQTLSETVKEADWNAAIQVVSDALSKNKPNEIAFLLGTASDHFFDLVSDLCKALGAPAPLRYSALNLFEARATLGEAARAVFGKPNVLFFDLEGADLTFSFGANFLETWIAPVAYTRGFAKMRRGNPRTGRGYLVQFESRMSQTASKADEWIPVVPGTEGLVAAALGKVISTKKFGESNIPAAFKNVDVTAISKASEVSLETFDRLAQLYVEAQHAIAIPGGFALGQSNGLENAKAILSLNTLADNLGKPGGVHFTPDSPLGDEYHAAATAKEISELINKMKSGAIKTLFVHGVNPVFELPQSMGFAAALSKVPNVISFSSFPDETATLADYIFPDHTGLEAFGYQRIPTGTGQSVLSGLQPVVVPLYNTKSSTDVILAAVAKVGGKLIAALPFKDEIAFIQSKVNALLSASDGYYNASEMATFWAQFQQYGGWWKNGQGLSTPTASLDQALDIKTPTYQGEYEFHLLPFVSPIVGEAGANKPWLQEIPDPTTTVTWGTWVEINPKTAEELGIENDDVVLITSSAGTLEVSVYKYPAIRPDTIAIPFGRGHTAYGRYAEGRGVNPADLLKPTFNEAGDLAFGTMKVKITKTGKKKQLARFEGVLGVYGYINEKK